ncbi:flagellar motor switch protein FliN [Tepidicaulis marinus]|jgi:flagellar motor switch protein FliN/FliY|uniref:Flagellar motor switch protein FliN n=1 Tax=Tepidicaulis marinus TaxID=1333998 RepID=A0A081BEL6_9HYPH|nr:flagellar motor switch protein FliN [Tepidicaulis marinus]GAK46484.1 flagellar motor switch protein FliN [Tepidicaulis marinus]
MSENETGMDLPDLSNTDAPHGAEDKSDAAQNAADPQRSAADLEAVFDVPVNVSAVLGKAHIEVSDLLKLGRGAVVELDRKVGEAIDIYVNDRLVARGEVVIVEDRLGVTMTEIIKTGISG